MERLAQQLRSLKAMDGWEAEKEQAVELVTRAAALVVMHETAEEAVLEPASLRSLFTEGEIRSLGF
jgi:hypothetical protein